MKTKWFVGMSVGFLMGISNSLWAQNPIIATIRLVDHEEVISYKKMGEDIFIREGTSEVQMSVANFKTLANLKLKTLAQNSTALSAEQKMLLERYLGDVSSSQKEEIASLIDELILDMEGGEIKRFRYSKDRERIAFHLLKAIVLIDSCSSEKTFQAPQGYMCKHKTPTGDAFWSLEVVTPLGGTRIWKDMKSELLVSDVYGRVPGYDAAKRICTNPLSFVEGYPTNINWGLPSGYHKGLNGKYEFPNQDSDFETLEAHGVRKVINTRGSWYWSSSQDPRWFVFNSACIFSGNDGGLVYSAAHHVSGGSALCIGR
ncbi:MAG: hypothetical protein HYW85_06995 [Deltaproteobacteria bacterium]|nr:hypothetical protein [Deltaproteobacteria bacterium]